MNDDVNTDLTSDSADYVAEALRRASVVDDVPADTLLIAIRKVGIIGAGTMGGGIAMNFASVGVPVHIVETGQDALDRGLGTVRANYERSAARGRFPAEEVAVRLGRISSSLHYDDLADCDLIIEAVFEDIELKKTIFKKLDTIVKPGAILATNTSGLDVDAIADVTRRPENVIGLHFFSPANVMKLVEIVRGAKSSPSTIATSLAMAKTIGKIAVVVGVCPGFVGNRMLYPRQLQAHALLQRGAMPWEVDRVLKDFGFKMGPFEMSDLAGLDIGWVPGEGDPLRDALCRAGRRGQKSRSGFYNYDESRAASPSPEATQIIRDIFGAGDGQAIPSDDEILASCLFPMVNEGAKILGEGIAQRPSDIDVVWMFGYSWPQATGGPMRWADSVGLDRIARKAEELGSSSEWYRPAPLLTQLIAEGRRFSEL